MTSIRLTNNDVQLNWNAPGGSNYVLQVATPLSSNFVDLGPSNFVPAGLDQLLSYTHPGARTSAISGLYRVRAFAPRLQIQPTNVMIAPRMTNRFKVFLLTSDTAPIDVTSDALSSFSSLNPTVARFVRISANGFATVRGINPGIASLQAVYQGGLTNTVSLMVSNMTGGMYTQPSSFSGYVQGQSSTGKVFGVFGSKTVNITPAADLSGNAVGVTRINYNVAADVANSFALVTGQSAADDSILFTAGDFQTPQVHVNWCEFTDMTLDPTFIQVTVGQTQELAVVGYRADGTSANVVSRIGALFFNTGLARAEQSASTLRVVGLAPGSTDFEIQVNNPVNCGDLVRIGYLTVTVPPVITDEPTSKTAVLGDDVLFNVVATGSQPIAYRWQFNGMEIGGATSSALTITNVSYAQQGGYRVIITNAYGSVTSSVATLAVVPSGVPLWTNRYNGPANSSDSAQAIAADSSGNVFVTGYAIVSGGTYDFATIKYSNAGVPLWTNRYNGPANSHDSAQAIAVDSSGNVLVTGYATVSGGTYDFATIKYSNAGVPLWTNRYNGPANSYDYAQAIAADSSGNVLVTGYATVSGGTYDFATIKYSNAGVPLWTNRYNGPANSYDYAQAIAVDSNGNVFVTGFATVTGLTDDFATIKYSNAGVPLWTNRYNGPANSSDSAQAIAADSSGNVFVTGYATVTGGVHDYATIKYSSAGIPLWTNRYNGPGNDYDQPKAITVDAGGNVLVTGSSIGSGTDYDFTTIKYSSSGVRLWTNRYNGTANNYDNAAGIAVDAAGDVFVTGASYGSDSTFDYATIKYSGAGLPLWTNRYSALGGESPVALGVDSSGNVFVTGSSSAGCTTLKYSSASEVLWLSRSGPRTPSAAAIDAGGNFIVAGSDDLGGQDYVTVKICSESAPANDTFSDRIVLSGFRIFTNANNDCASREPGEPSHAGNAGGKSLWWSWPALASGPVTVNTCGSSFDSLLAVYTGNAVNALTPVASNNDSLCSGDPDIQSEVQFNAVAGTTYQIAVDGFKYPDEPGARAGQINLTISPTRAPLAVSGWNMDVVMENDGAPYAKNFDFYYQQFEGLNGACWFESGLGGHADGLPATRMLANALNSNVVFELQPYDTNNVLRLDLDPGEESGSLTLASRGRYSTIYVLAASGRTGSGPAVGSVVLHFTDGSSSAALPFNAPDWLATSPGLAISRLGRSLSSGTNFVYEYVGATGFGLYQSEINLAGLGLSGKFLQSLTFTKPGGNSSPETTGIFAISGLRAPP